MGTKVARAKSVLKADDPVSTALAGPPKGLYRNATEEVDDMLAGYPRLKAHRAQLVQEAQKAKTA